MSPLASVAHSNLKHITKEQELLKYLDRTGNLTDFRDAFHLHEKERKSFYLNNGFHPQFDFIVHIDPEMLFELSGDLGFLFVQEVHLFKTLLTETLVNYANFLALSFSDGEDEGHPFLRDNMTIWLELASDHFPILNFLFSRETAHIYSLQLQKLTGCLIYVTAPKKCEKSKLYQCESRACRHELRLRHGRKPAACILTGHAMVEVPRAAEVVEYWEARFLYETGCLPLDIRIPARIFNLEWKLGHRYNVVFHFDLYRSMYSAWYICEALPDLSPFLLSLPESIQIVRTELENLSAHSPWTLVSYMAAELCSSVAPKGIFQNLKMGLLLSLASMGCNAGKPMSLFCLGPEPSTLVTEASHLAHHRIDSSGNPPAQGCVEGELSGEELGAGPLQMGRDGICYLGEWSKYESGGKHSVASKVLKALEDGYISMTNQGKSHLCPMKCSVWVTNHWVPNCKTKSSAALKVIFDSKTALCHHHHKGFFHVASVVQDIKRNLCAKFQVPRNFGMPFILDFASEQESQEYTSFVLKKSLQSGERNNEVMTEFISRHDFQQYLDVVRTMPVEVHSSSQEVISNYFVATRRSRPECSFPIASITKLSVLAESHARLRLSRVVTHEDATAVILLYEQAMSYVYGKSICTTVCPPMEMDFENPAQIHNTMLRFSLWLDQYIRTYIRASSIGSRDNDSEVNY